MLTNIKTATRGQKAQGGIHFTFCSVLFWYYFCHDSVLFSFQQAAGAYLPFSCAPVTRFTHDYERTLTPTIQCRIIGLAKAIVQFMFSRQTMLLRHISPASFCIFHCQQFPWFSLHRYCWIVFVANWSFVLLWQAISVYWFLAVCKCFLLLLLSLVFTCVLICTL